MASVWGMRNHARTENGAIMIAIIKTNAISLNPLIFFLILTDEAKVPSPRCE